MHPIAFVKLVQKDAQCRFSLRIAQATHDKTPLPIYSYQTILKLEWKYDIHFLKHKVDTSILKLALLKFCGILKNTRIFEIVLIIKCLLSNINTAFKNTPQIVKYVDTCIFLLGYG